MSLIPIRTARPEERRRAMGTVVLAFNSDPTMRWFWDDPGDYLEFMVSLTQAFAGRSFDLDTAYVTPGFEGVSLWLPPGVGPDGPALEALVQDSIRQAIVGEVEELVGQMEHFHIDEPHWYLPVIGVEPLHHGKGLGGALLRHALAICDRDDLPAYLESSNPRNVSLYERHSFEAVGEIQAGSSPVVTPMLRRRRSER